MASLRATAPVTLTTTADATNLVNLRNQFKAAAAAGEIVPGYTDFLVKLVAVALQKHPMLAARWAGEEIVLRREHRHRRRRGHRRGAARPGGARRAEPERAADGRAGRATWPSRARAGR